MEKAVRKYLQSYAEPEVELAPQLTIHADNVLVVPAFAEAESLLGALASVPRPRRGRALVIIVLNAPVTASPPQLAATAQSLQELCARYGVLRRYQRPVPASLHAAPFGWLLVVERWQEQWQLAPKRAVGLARKIGCDLALALWAGEAASSPWIHCSDADVRLPSDYFERSTSENPAVHAGLIYPFVHDSEAASRYEISLRYYVLGLAYAGSRYAYHSIGSTLAVSARHYAQARGFPRRQAAEDYYLLNKLAKLAPLQCLSGPPIRVSGRASSRVPFGTGMAVSRLLAQPADAPLLYHPQIFLNLRSHLASMGNSVKAHDRFDALQTLKWVHRERDRGLASLPFRQALASAPFINAHDFPWDIASAREICDLLEQHERARYMRSRFDGTH